MPGTNFPAFAASPKTINTNKVGTYYIDYTAVDTAGNRGSHIRTVTVVPTTFSDVLASHWAYPYVENLYEQGIVRGYGETGEEYRPANKLTREHAATIISRAAGLSGSGKEANFSDLTPDNDYYPFIAALVDKGAITGFPDGTFRGRENIRRGHAAKIVALAFDLKMGSQTVSFSDMPSDPEICEYIMILASNGIISGYSDTGEFRPNNQITRAEFAKIISIAQEVAAKQNP